MPLQTTFHTNILSIVTLIVIPSISKVAGGFSNIFFTTILTSQKIIKQFMIYLTCPISNTADKTYTAQKMKFSIEDFFINVTKSAGNCVATYFTRTLEDTMGHGIIIGSNFSFTFIDNVFWLIILSKFFNKGWYITTNDTPWLPLSFLFVFICSTFVNFLPCHKSEPPLTHFLNVFCWLLLCLWMIACYMNELANFYSSCLFFNALFTYLHYI